MNRNYIIKEYLDNIQASCRERVPVMVLVAVCLVVIGMLGGCAGGNAGRSAGKSAKMPLGVEETVTAEAEMPAGTEISAGMEMPVGTEMPTGTELRDPQTDTAQDPQTQAWASHQGVLIGENQDLLSREQLEAIFSYMDRYYEALARLEMSELSDLFSEKAAAQTAFHRNVWEYMIGVRTMQRGDLRLDGYLYRLWIIAAEQREDGSVDVDMGEQSFLRFAESPGSVSEYPGYWHDFVLVQEHGKWVILEHMQWEGSFWNMLKGYDETDLEELTDAEQIFAERKEKLLKQAADDLNGREQARVAGANQQESAAGADRKEAAAGVPRPYNRKAAVAYAREYLDERNPDWHDYSGQGGNCQNYVSQCLLAGGIPMDLEGDARWKWFGEELNDSAAETGCTLSWINVDAFYEYARSNTGAGLKAETDADFDSGQVGDLVMMGTPDDWNHIVIITEVVKNENGEVVDYLVCSNTTDVRDFPASAYPSPRRALIRILGWN